MSSMMTGRKPIPRKERINMYRDYCNELQQYDADPTPWDMRQALGCCENYMRDKAFEWVDIYQDGVLCGFLVIGYDLPNHGEGVYICEAYVKPGYRRNGLMSEAVRSKLRSKRGKIYLSIFDKNVYAQEFWGALLRDCRAGMMYQEVVNEGSGLTEYTFEI